MTVRVRTDSVDARPPIPILTATSMLVLGTTDRRAFCGAAASVLSWPVLVWMGQRAYGIYLFHWPLIVLMDRTVGILPAFAPLVAGASVAAAALSYRFIEAPVRAWRADARPRGPLRLAAFVAASAAVASLTWSEGRMLNEWSSVSPVPAGAFDPPSISELRGPACGPELTVIGDSHAQMLWPMLRDFSAVDGFTIHNGTGSGFLVSERLWLERPGASFPDRPSLISQEIDRVILSGPGPRAVLIACRFSFYLGSAQARSPLHVRAWLRDGDRRLDPSSDEALAAVESSLDVTFARLGATGVGVIRMEPVPQLAQPTLVGLLMRGRLNAWWTASQREAHDDRARSMMQRLAARHPNVTLWDPVPDLGNGIERGWEGNELVYRDDNHLSAAGSRRTLSGFRDAVRRAAKRADR